MHWHGIGRTLPGRDAKKKEYSPAAANQPTVVMCRAGLVISSVIRQKTQPYSRISGVNKEYCTEYRMVMFISPEDLNQPHDMMVVVNR